MRRSNQIAKARECVSGNAARVKALRASHRLFAEDGDAPHQAPLAWAEIGAGMQRAAIVPHQKVAWTPHMFVDEFAALLVIEQQVEQLVAFLRGQSFDP